VTIDLGVSFDERFNPNLESDFDDDINGDEDINNKNI
jgi:hypothetical protein